MSALSSPPVAPIVSSRLLENYLDVAAIDQTRALVVFEVAGQLELFTIGSDSSVYNLRPSSSGDGSYQVLDTNLVATQIAGGLDPSGNRVVFGVNAGTVFFTSSSDGTTWAAPAQLGDSRYASNVTRVLYRAFAEDQLSSLEVQVAMSTPLGQGPFSWVHLNRWLGSDQQTEWLGYVITELNAQVALTRNGAQSSLTALITQQLAFFTTSVMGPLLYDDHNAGGPMDVALWRPQYPWPFQSVGDYTQTNYQAPSGTMVGLASLDGPTQEPLLAQPMSSNPYQQIYLDRGSNAYMDGGIWWPNAPAGYTALGGVANGADNSSGWNPPAISVVNVLRSDFTVPASFGSLIWQNNVKSGMTSVSLWQILPPSDGGGQAMNGFWAEPDHASAPSGTVSVPRSAKGSAAAFITSADQTVFTSPMINGPFSVVAAAAADSKAAQPMGLPPLAIVQQDGNVYTLDQTQASWAMIPAPATGISFSSVGAEVAAAQEALVVAALATTGELYVAEQPVAGFGAAPPLLVGVASGVAQFTMAKDRDGEPQIFFISTAGELRRIWRLAKDSDWQVETLTVNSPGKVREVRSYNTEISILDSGGVTKPLAKARLWASGAVDAIVNGNAVRLDPVDGAAVLADASGRLTIDVIAEDLATVSLKLHTELMAEDDRIELQPNAQVKERLATVTAAQLGEAKVAGAPLLPGKTSGDLEHLSCALNHVAGLAIDPAPPAPPRPAFVRSSPNRHVWLDEGGSPAAGRFRDEIPAERLRSARGFAILREPGDRLTCATLLPREARALRERLERESVRSAPDSWLSGLPWGQLWAAVRSGVIQLSHFVVDQGWLLLRTAANEVYKFELKAYQQIFDVLQEVFSWVKVEVRKAIDWLAQLFDWGDILRTRTVLRHTLDQGFSFLETLVTKVGDRIDREVRGLERELDDLFDKILPLVGGQSLGASLGAAPPVQAASSANDHNILSSALTAHAGNAKFPTRATAAPPGPEEFSLWDDLISDVKSKLSSIDTGEGFPRALEALRQLFKNPAELPSLGMAALLGVAQGLVRLFLEVARASLGIAMAAVKALVETMRQVLNATIEIPVLGPLYRRLTGDDLSLIDLFSLLLALPATVTFKLLHQETAPFPDEASVEAVRGAFTASWLASLLDGWIDVEAEEGARRASRQALPAALAAYRVFIPVVGLDALLVRAVLVAAVDAGLPKQFAPDKPGGLRIGPPPTGLSAGLVVMELLLQFFQMPWWFTDDFSTGKASFDRLTWAIPGWIGPAANLLAFIISWRLGLEAKTPAETLRTFNDVTVGLTVAIGAFSWLWNIAGIALFSRELSGVDIALRLTEPLNNVLDFLRLSHFGPWLVYTIPGLVAADVLLGLGTAVLFFASAVQALKPPVELGEGA